MGLITVIFTFHSGMKRHLFDNVRLSGSWDANGEFSSLWTETETTAWRDETGCEAFTASVELDAAEVGTTFQWGMVADLAGAPNTWVVSTEVPDENSYQRYRSFILSADSVLQEYWFATGRRFGAQKCFLAGAASPAIRFTVWAPHATKVEAVCGTDSGYIADDGTGIDPEARVIPLTAGTGGVWASDAVSDFSDFVNLPYMYRITNEQG